MTAPRTPCAGATSPVSVGSWSAAVVGGMVIGLLVDDQAGTTPVGALVGISVGVAAGAVGFWLRVRSALRD